MTICFLRTAAEFVYRLLLFLFKCSQTSTVTVFLSSKVSILLLMDTELSQHIIVNGH